MKKSAGILLYRNPKQRLEVMLVHPGGPFWTKKDLGVWSIPKGEFTDNEEPLDAAMREFYEETGSEIKGVFLPLTPVHQDGKKIIYGFACELDFDVSTIKSNTFLIDWPPKSGRQMEIPEIDRGEWFNLKMGKKKISRSQVALLDELVSILTFDEAE